jgi:hypothetical protein
MIKPYPKYHPPIDLPYAEVPQGRSWDVYPSPHQRIGKKERRLWGATVSQVPYAYEDPYLTDVQDIQYTVNTSKMHRYPYVRPGEDPGRMPMLFEEPFPSATGSANYMNTFGDDAFFFGGDIPFKSKDEGNVFRAWVNDNHKDWAKKNKLSRTGDYNNKYIKKAWKEFGEEWQKSQTSQTKKGFDVDQALNLGGKIVGLFGPKQSAQSDDSGDEGSSSSSSSSSLADIESAISKINSDLTAIKNSPEPQAFSNLFAQVAENEKINVVQRMQSGQQVPISVRQTQQMQQELTERSADLQKSGEKLEKEKKKNNVLLYTSIGGGITVLGLVTYLLLKK